MLVGMAIGIVCMFAVGLLYKAIESKWPKAFESNPGWVWERYLNERIRDAPDATTRASWQALKDKAKAEGRF